ncbi:MAG: helicase [Prevotella sp.]|nr:helicase [Prevotella sp.]
MNKETFINGETLGVSQQGILAVEQFLLDNYNFRRNVLNGKVEFVTLSPNSSETGNDWKPLTQRALNSIIIRAEKEQICEKGCPKSDIQMYVNSDEVEAYDPIQDFLKGLPSWDGQNHVAKLFSRLPGVDSEILNYLAIWLRSCVAHWLQMDTLHGNECVPTLIGDQGCGKTTFLRRLLPMHLRQYFLDHLNLSNKFDKDMALSNNLIVNLDELEAIRPSQQASLKQTLSKSNVNGRPIFGSVQEDRPRYASFVATTNNPHPLSDVTGSRRYICITIPKGQYIDNSGEIGYEQLFAQVVYEIREQKSHYWFDNQEVARIQELNQNYMQKKNLAEMATACFRKPAKDELCRQLNCTEIIGLIQNDYPSVKNDASTKVQLGFVMKKLGFDVTESGHKSYYSVVPLHAA